MKNGRSFGAIIMIALLGLTLGACKKPPTDALEASRQALEDAEDARQCARAEYDRAEDLLRQANEAVEDKDYDRALDLANRAKAEAERAVEVAEANPYYPECDLADEVLQIIDEIDSMSALRACAPDRYQEAVDLASDARAALDAKEFDSARTLANQAKAQLDAARTYAQSQPGYPRCADEEEVTDDGSGTHSWQRVQFAFDSSSLDRTARRILDGHAGYLNDNSDTNITIEGHCSAEGTAEYNMALGQRRANAAKRYIENQGISGSRLRTVSYGEERPLEPNAGAINRRAEFRTR